MSEPLNKRQLLQGNEAIAHGALADRQLPISTEEYEKVRQRASEGRRKV